MMKTDFPISLSDFLQCMPVPSFLQINSTSLEVTSWNTFALRLHDDGINQGTQLKPHILVLNLIKAFRLFTSYGGTHKTPTLLFFPPLLIPAL